MAVATGGASVAASTIAAYATAGAAIGDAAVDQPAAAQKKALEAQQTQSAAATAAAQKQATAAEEANNRANAKTPDVGAMLAANQQAAKAGGSSTMLTGPQGVDTSSLNLGKNTLLGS
jgi:hypothetical protein